MVLQSTVVQLHMIQVLHKMVLEMYHEKGGLKCVYTMLNCNPHLRDFVVPLN